MVWFCHLSARKRKKWRRSVVIELVTIRNEPMAWTVYGTQDNRRAAGAIRVDRNTAAHTMMKLTAPTTFFACDQTFLVHVDDLRTIPDASCPSTTFEDLVKLSRQHAAARKLLDRKRPGECDDAPSD